jgi:hypothetical protein
MYPPKGATRCFQRKMSDVEAYEGHSDDGSAVSSTCESSPAVRSKRVPKKNSLFKDTDFLISSEKENNEALKAAGTGSALKRRPNVNRNRNLVCSYDPLKLAAENPYNVPLDCGFAVGDRIYILDYYVTAGKCPRLMSMNMPTD